MIQFGLINLSSRGEKEFINLGLEKKETLALLQNENEDQKKKNIIPCHFP